MIAVRHYDGSGSLKVKVIHNGVIIKNKAVLYTAEGKYYVRLDGDYKEIISPNKIMDTTNEVII